MEKLNKRCRDKVEPIYDLEDKRNEEAMKDALIIRTILHFKKKKYEILFNDLPQRDYFFLDGNWD